MAWYYMATWGDNITNIKTEQKARGKNEKSD